MSTAKQLAAHFHPETALLVSFAAAAARRPLSALDAGLHSPDADATFAAELEIAGRLAAAIALPKSPETDAVLRACGQEIADRGLSMDAVRHFVKRAARLAAVPK